MEEIPREGFTKPAENLRIHTKTQVTHGNSRQALPATRRNTEPPEETRGGRESSDACECPADPNSAGRETKLDKSLHWTGLLTVAKLG